MPDTFARIKPHSHIDRWEDWPADVTPILRGLNHQSLGRLSFRRQGLFTCAGCAELCGPHRYGDAKLDARALCDSCLIKYARGELTIVSVEGLTATPTPTKEQA